MSAAIGIRAETSTEVKLGKKWNKMKKKKHSKENKTKKEKSDEKKEMKKIECDLNMFVNVQFRSSYNLVSKK